MGLMWLSFVDTSDPRSHRFLGVSIVRAGHIVEAVKVSHALGINPGGEVKAIQVPDDIRIPDHWIERLLNKAECVQLEQEMADGVS